jgi:succinoglycan biosynthesis transport protein ExoP
MLPEPDGTNSLNPANPPAPANGPAPGSAPPSGILPRVSIGRPGQAPLPPALTRAPNFLLLLKALGRRWLLAANLGLLLAALAGGGVFFFMPPPKHTVRTLIHVPPHRGIVFKQASSAGDLSNHQRTQVAMLRSRLVLSSALRDPKVAKLEVVREEVEPVEWLEKEIQVDFAVAPEVLRITLSGDKPDQLVILVDALVRAYRREVVDNEKNQRREHLNTLRGLREKYEGELRRQHKEQREIEKNAGGRDAAVRALMLNFERQHLAMAERELLQAQSKLRDARLELQLIQDREKKSSPEATIPDIVVDEQVDKTMEVTKLLAEDQKLQDYIEALRRALRDPESHTTFQEAAQKQKRVRQALAKQREEARPRILQQLLERTRLLATSNSGVLKGRIAGLEGTEKLLLPEVERLRTVVQSLAENSVKLDAFRDDISHTEDLVKRLIHEEQTLNVELEAPTEFKILEEAQVLHAQTKVRMALMSAGAAAGGLALALLAVGWWEFRRRRIDAAQNITQDLGLRVVGALPHSARRRSRRLLGGNGRDSCHDLLLTESIDSTRTMLLHLARSESVQVVMVTSAIAGEGKTSLTCHLAVSMARIGLKTLLIDGDLRNPTAHRLFEVDNDSGLSELLLGERDLHEVVRPTAVNGLSLLPAGIWDSQVSQVLAQSYSRAIFDHLRKEYDFILVDSSPVLPVADALMIGQIVDGVIFSILCEVSRLPSVYTATQRVAALGIRTLGAIINGAQGELYVSSYPYVAGSQNKVENEVSA